MEDAPHCRNGHERTEENTYRPKGVSWVECRVCRETRRRKMRADKRDEREGKPSKQEMTFLSRPSKYSGLE